MEGERGRGVSFGGVSDDYGSYLVKRCCPQVRDHVSCHDAHTQGCQQPQQHDLRLTRTFDLLQESIERVSKWVEMRKNAVESNFIVSK